MTDWTDPDTFGTVLDETETLEKGNYAEDFAVGDVIEHKPGLRLAAWGNELWMSQTLNYDPAFWRAEVAADRGYEEPPIHPDYLLAATLGATVEDLSEKGGYFLGRTDVSFPQPAVSPGTELSVESEVLSVERSRSRPAYAIVTWRTRGRNTDTGAVLCTYERTNMIPRESADDTDVENHGSTDSAADETADPVSSAGPFLTPDGPYFEDFVAALDVAAEHEGTVAYQHDRGRTIDDVTLAQLPLSTLNTAKQHHNADAMADSPSGDVVAYGDVTRSIALGHARSDEATYRERGFDDERFHAFVESDDTIYSFTRVLDARDSTAVERASGSRSGGDGMAERAETDSSTVAGTVRFQHVAYNQKRRPVYSGTRTALIRKRSDQTD